MAMVDFGKTAADYRHHRAGFPKAFFERLSSFGLGQTVLDIGTGTGTLARGLAQRGCQVMGLDPSAEMMAQAALLDAEVGVQVTYRVGQAENTGLPDNHVDVVTAGQCWHWFDRPRAAQEIRRVLKPSGHLVIAHFDWLPLPNNVVALTEALIKQYNPTWNMDGGTGLYPAWLTDVAIAGFTDIETFSFDSPTLYSHAAWRGRIRASAGVAASLSAEKVTQFDTELAELLSTHFPTDPLLIPHRVFAVICRAPI